MNGFKVVVIGMALGTMVFAKGGSGGGGGNEILKRGTAAWFLYESVEQEARGLVEFGQATEAGMTRAFGERTGARDVRLALSTNNGSVSDDCVMYDHASHHGTILKKEVRCRRFIQEPRRRLTVGSDAWAVVEGLEHSLRLAVAADALVLGSAQSVESSLSTDGSVAVEIGLSNGNRARYLCLREYYGQFSATHLSCSLQP